MDLESSHKSMSLGSRKSRFPRAESGRTGSDDLISLGVEPHRGAASHGGLLGGKPLWSVDNCFRGGGGDGKTARFGTDIGSR